MSAELPDEGCNHGPRSQFSLWKQQERPMNIFYIIGVVVVVLVVLSFLGLR